MMTNYQWRGNMNNKIECVYCGNYIEYIAEKDIYDLEAKDRILDCKHAPDIYHLCKECGIKKELNLLLPLANGDFICRLCEVKKRRTKVKQ